MCNHLILPEQNHNYHDCQLTFACVIGRLISAVFDNEFETAHTLATHCSVCATTGSCETRGRKSLVTSHPPCEGHRLMFVCGDELIAIEILKDGVFERSDATAGQQVMVSITRLGGRPAFGTQGQVCLLMFMLQC